MPSLDRDGAPGMSALIQSKITHSIAIEKARALASKDGLTLGTIKRNMYTRAHKLLLDVNPQGLEVLIS
jgi:hypothetical protein